MGKISGVPRGGTNLGFPEGASWAPPKLMNYITSKTILRVKKTLGEALRNVAARAKSARSATAFGREERKQAFADLVRGRVDSSGSCKLGRVAATKFTRSKKPTPSSNQPVKASPPATQFEHTSRPHRSSSRQPADLLQFLHRRDYPQRRSLSLLSPSVSPSKGVSPTEARAPPPSDCHD